MIATFLGLAPATKTLGSSRATRVRLAHCLFGRFKTASRTSGSNDSSRQFGGVKPSGTTTRSNEGITLALKKKTAEVGIDPVERRLGAVHA
jgi:hypothetical protein